MADISDRWWALTQGEQDAVNVVVEGRDGGTGHDCGHADHIGWIEGPFARKPAARNEQ